MIIKNGLVIENNKLVKKDILINNGYIQDIADVIDIVDETIANIQAFNQRLYTNESGIGEEITRRLESLQQAQRLEQGNYYSTGSEIEDLDQYEVDGYDKLLKYDETFEVELTDGEDD